MCNNVRNGFKNEKCPKHLGKTREQESLRREGLREPWREAPPPGVSWSGSRGTLCDVVAARVWIPGASLYKGPNKGVGAGSPSPLLTPPPVLQTGF